MYAYEINELRIKTLFKRLYIHFILPQTKPYNLGRLKSCKNRNFFASGT